MSTVQLDEFGRPVGFLRPAPDLETVMFEVDDGVGVLTLNRPDKLNAFDEQMLREIRSVVWRVSFDDAIRVLVITGSGRAFCAGRDIPGLSYENNLPSPQYRAYVRANHEMLDDLESLEKPVVASVNGICAGGGVELATSCDFRIVSQDASFLLPEINLGVLPASGACSRMIQMVGIARVKEMVMLGLPVSADEAYRVGLANRAVPAADLREETMDFARTLASRAPLALGMAKHIINQCQNVDTETGRSLERLGQSVLVQSADAAEGVLAFQEKRPPRFQGR